MTATATQRRALWLGHTHAPREGVTKALRGTLWRPGWLLVAHNDRLMPNPTGGFNNANAVNDGGPLSVAGADADGGLRIIEVWNKIDRFDPEERDNLRNISARRITSLHCLASRERPSIS